MITGLLADDVLSAFVIEEVLDDRPLLSSPSEFNDDLPSFLTISALITLLLRMSC